MQTPFHDKINAALPRRFLCALHPDMRKPWAETWARLLAPGGYLITMVFPVDSTMDPLSGPPWPLTPELYTALLPEVGFECVSLQPIEKEMSFLDRQGREHLGIWRRK